MNKEFHWFASLQHTSDVCLSIPYVFKAHRAWRLSPGLAVAKLHLAAASDLFSSTQAHPGQRLLFGITELRAWFWIPVHCLPLSHKLSLHQPDGLKCVLTPTSAVSYRALAKCSINMFWTERFTEQEELSDITSWHQYCVASVFGRGWGACGAGVTSLKPFCMYISPNENPAESKQNLPCVSPPQEGDRAGIRTDISRELFQSTPSIY